ncbi:MAG: hypothetical protein WA188_08155 [Terriglobales bacterium]
MILCIMFPLASFTADKQQPSYKVIYDGGSLPDVKAGSGMKLYIDSNNVRLVTDKKDKTEVANIPASAITEISYGQDVRRRVEEAVALGIFTLGIGGLLVFSKSKKHYIGLTWANGDQKGGLAMQCDKSDYRGILAGLEGVTGKKAVDSKPMTVKN